MQFLKTIKKESVILTISRMLANDIPSDFMEDIKEWIYEVIRELDLDEMMVRAHATLPIKGHCVKLPCTYYKLVAVEDKEGRRVARGTDVTNPVNPTNIFQENARNPSIIDRTTGFFVTPDQQRKLREINPMTGVRDIIYERQNQANAGDNIFNVEETMRYYIPELDYLKFPNSMENETVKVHMYVYPLDCDGFPLIPDENNTKQCMMWYVLSRLKANGFKMKEETFTFDRLERRYEDHLKYAYSALTKMTLDEAESLRRSNVRLIFEDNRWETFDINGEQREEIDTHFDRYFEHGY